jgi:hypothetical protein
MANLYSAFTLVIPLFSCLKCIIDMPKWAYHCKQVQLARFCQFYPLCCEMDLKLWSHAAVVQLSKHVVNLVFWTQNPIRRLHCAFNVAGLTLSSL